MFSNFLKQKRILLLLTHPNLIQTSSKIIVYKRTIQIFFYIKSFIYTQIMELEMIKKCYQEFKDLSKTHSWSKTQGEEVTKLKDVLISQIQAYRDHCSEDLIPRAIAMEACVYYEHARFSTNPNGSPESILEKALTILKDYVLHKECIFIYLRVVYYYSYLLVRLNSLNAALNILEEAETVYNKLIISKETSYCTPDDIFSSFPVIKDLKNNFIKIERLTTSNMQLQSYIYNKLGLFDKYAEYYHMVLQRQLEMADGEPASWAMKTARLSLHFLTQYNFLEARHHLFAAYNVLKICIDKSQKKATLENRKSSNISLNLHLQLAGLGRIWVKYGLFLFSASKKVLLTKYFNTKGSFHHDIWSMQGDNETGTLGEDPLIKTANNNNHSAKPDGDVNDSSGNDLNSTLRFPTLKLEELEKRVTADLLQTTDQAHALFIFTNSWLVQAKDYYYLTQYPIEYINCVLDLSELYEHLAFFEKDVDRQYNVQKRRADTLEMLNLALKETRPQEFGIIAVDVLRELTEVQMDLMALNLRRLWMMDDSTEVEDIAKKEKGSLGSKNSIFQSCENVPAVNSYVLRKMEAASHVNAKLLRLSEHLSEQAHQNANIISKDVPLKN